MKNALISLGRAARGALAFVGGLSRLCAALAGAVLGLPRLNLPLLLKIAVNQIRFSGVQAMPLVALIAGLVGAISIVESFNKLTSAAPDLIGPLLATVIVRDLGPLVTSVILIGRSGTAIATELGSMRLSGELDDLRAFRIDPIAFVVLPRIVGVVFSLFSLIVLFDLMGILGGYGISLLIERVSFALVRDRIMSELNNWDLIFSALKALLFGSAIAALPCYFGLRVRRPTDLPRAVTKAVVACMVAVVAMDAIMVAAFYFL